MLLPTSARRLVSALALAGLATTASTTLAQSPGAERFAPEIGGHVDRMYADLDAVYKDLHAHPEIAYEEVRTAATLARAMRALGFEVTEQVGKTGLVALYRNGAGPTVMVRTELDALPMEEKTGLPYASRAKSSGGGRETFVAHSCGHDIHMAAWLGTARTLLAMKGQWAGTLMFVAQPAEELVSGARAMVADGLFTRFPKPDVAFALHVGPGPVGAVTFGTGAVTSNSDALEITFKGRGGHGSAPHRTIDPIAIAARFVTDVQSVVSREKDPFEFGVVTIGAFQAGTVGNIIPDAATLRGTIRSYKPEVRAKLLDGVRRTANAAAAMAGAPAPEVALVEGGLAVVNTDTVVLRTEAIFKAAFGAVNVQRTPPNTASEDFSVYINEGVPAFFFSIGGNDRSVLAASMKPGGPPLPVNHSPFFAPLPEPSIKTGVQAMTLAVLGAFGR